MKVNVELTPDYAYNFYSEVFISIFNRELNPTDTGTDAIKRVAERAKLCAEIATRVRLGVKEVKVYL